ncbi:MAG: DNA methylase [Bacilli bacterium]|nr:DNA methylase [Bacilli bacterium]
MKKYICIDLKSFYASVECMERGLNPLTTNLVVADASRTEKTICLAVSPSLKSFGLPGRARLFEVVSKVKEINRQRQRNILYKDFKGSSYDINDLNNKWLKLDYIVARPRMSLYIKYSTNIYNIYLKYLDKKDIYVYSIDEVFCDITNYLKYYHMTAEELVTNMIQDVYKQTGITATAGIGTNLYLAKIAMDIVAKHTKPNNEGVRIASLDEMRYRKLLWHHQPLSDFWRVGNGYLKKLNEHKLYTMGDIARCSIDNEDILYKLFGVNAELLIDHAWGYEPVTLEDIKNYKPNNNCLTSGQVLHEPYDYRQTKIIVKEMMELLSLDLVRKGLVTNQIVLTIGYDKDNLNEDYKGEIVLDRYGRCIPKHATGRISIDHYTSSTDILMQYIIDLYEKIINKDLLVRRINIVVNNVIKESIARKEICYEQFDIFGNNEEKEKELKMIREKEQEERCLQHTMLELKDKYGKNKILKAMNLVDGATTMDRNNQIGGHHA